MTVLLREAIGDSIRRARTERRRTLRDVSRDARVSLGYLSEIERGRKEPSSELLAAICDALALTLPDLLDEAADVMRPDGARRARAAAAVVDPRLRSAVEEAFGPAADAAEEGAAGPSSGDAPAARGSAVGDGARASMSVSSPGSDPTLPPDALAGDEEAGVDGVLDGLAVGDRAGEHAVPGTVTLIARLPAPGGSVRVAA